MFCTVEIQNINKLITVTTSWIKNFKCARLFNNGIKANRMEIYKIFYSDDIHAKEDFDLEISNEFKTNACFYGKVIDIHGKFNETFIIVCSFVIPDIKNNMFSNFA